MESKMEIKRFATYQTFIVVGFLMTIGTALKLLGFWNISSDWFWLLAGDISSLPPKSLTITTVHGISREHLGDRDILTPILFAHPKSGALRLSLNQTSQSGRRFLMEYQEANAIQLWHGLHSQEIEILGIEGVIDNRLVSDSGILQRRMRQDGLEIVHAVLGPAAAVEPRRGQFRATPSFEPLLEGDHFTIGFLLAGGLMRSAIDSKSLGVVLGSRAACLPRFSRAFFLAGLGLVKFPAITCLTRMLNLLLSSFRPAGTAVCACTAACSSLMATQS
jgi:hypothetical protein